MKTNFFTELQKLNLKQVNLSMLFKDNNVTIILLPKSSATDNATKLKPLSLSAPIDEMDNDFFNHITKPLKDVGTFLSNVENFEKDKAIKQQNTAEKKELKAKVDKLETKLKTVVESAEFNPNDDKSKVILICKDILILNPKNKLAIEWNTKINELTTKNLFD